MITLNEWQIYLNFYFLNFYFLNVDISFTMHNPNLKLKMCIKNIVVGGRMSQIFYRDPGSFFLRFRKKYSIKKRKSYPFFDIKQKLRPK